MRITFLLVTLVFACSSYAQSTTDTELVINEAHGDTVRVALSMDAPGDSLEAGVWAFEFVVSTDSLVQFLGVDSAFTLSAKQGWTTAANPVRKWVGGFASSRDAIETGGTLVTFDLFVPDGANGSVICLQRLRLNSGNPASNPVIPCAEVRKTGESEE